MHWMEIRALKASRNCSAVRPQSLIGQSGQRRRIRFTVADGVQHATRAGAQQIGHDTRYLDVAFLEERLQPVVELHTAARDLVLAAHHGPPEPLLGVGHKTERQLLRDQALHQTFRIGKVSLAPAGSPIGLRLCEVQRAGDGGRIAARSALRFSGTNLIRPPFSVSIWPFHADR